MDIGFRKAEAKDIPILAQMNQALIRDEGSENPMDLSQLNERMRGFLAGEYRALILLCWDAVMGYCLYKPENMRDGRYDIYVRQYYILPEYRRQGLGRRAFRILADNEFQTARHIELDVLESNAAGRSFWESAGFAARYRHLRYRREGD